jgi:hypothetical protein
MTAETQMWGKLAEPFPDHEIKQRPGRGNMTFSYVDARAVMQRLDDVVTPAGWEFTSSVIPGTDIVHGRLTVAGFVREDYGYPNSDHDDEPIKAASSDALKRCAVMFGIGRHLYDDNRPASNGRAAPPPPARPSAPPRPVVVDSVPEEPDDFAEVFQAIEATRDFPPIGVAKPGDVCEEHGVQWRGEMGDLYHPNAEGVDPKWHRHPGNTKKTARRAS